MMSEFEALRAESQKQLNDFLRVELEIGVTFVQSAMLARKQDHMDHSDQAKGNALKAAACIRHFMRQLADPAVRIEIEHKLAALDRQISEL
jgi:predicted aldo/keto reductase-like oxidoreductase